MKIIIYGANETGSLIATEFFEDYDIIVIDPDHSNLENFSKLDISSVLGDASNTDILKEADIKTCDLFIACTNDDEANIVACMMVKSLFCAQTVCFVSRKACLKSLNTVQDEGDRSFIDYIIWPEKLLTREIFEIVTVPDAVDVEVFEQGEARLLEYRIKENSILLNKMIKDCSIPDETLIVGIVRDDELDIPTGLSELKLNDKVIFMGTPEGLDVTSAELFVGKAINRITIIGGGSVGFELAKSLEKTSVKTKIIEQNYERCEYLSENLKKALVLHGNGADANLLIQECVGESDVAICVTDSDEKNLLCSLLAKQLGAKRVITRTGHAITASLFEKVGVDIAISAKEAAVNEIKNKIIESKNNILATVERGLGEIIEIQIGENYKDMMLMNLKMPTKAIIAIIKRQSKIIIPKGQTLIRANDRLIVFTKAQDVETVRNHFR